MCNPYRGFGCPVSGAGFVGRKKVVEEILDVLRGGNVFLTGLHRVGKSSVAEEVLARLKAEGVSVGRLVNVNTVKSEYDLFRLMLISLGSPKARELSRDDTFMAYIETQEAFEAKKRERTSHVVMVIDEFDGILSFEDPVQTLNRLRELAYYPNRFGVRFLFVSSRSLNTIETRMAGSNLSGICENMFLVPFDHEEAAEFVARSGIVDEGFVGEVYSQTGGVPYLMAVLMSKFCERCGENAADLSAGDRTEILDKCVSDVSHAFMEYYAKVRHMLSDADNAWAELIGTIIGPVVKNRDPALANLFREYGIVQDGGNCGSVHFRDYLEMCSRDIAPFEDLRAIEVGLRKMVKKQLVDKLGNLWADEICRDLPCVARGLEAAKEKLEKEIRQFHLASETDLIEFTDLGDIKEIVTSKKYWPYFQQPVGMGLADFRKHMDRIIPMRNRTMHHRPGELLPPDQVALARESCKALLARIK